MKRPCPKCGPTVDDEALLEQTLREYVRSIPPEELTDAAEYDRRLAACMECGHCIGKTCMLCGCFCRARAAKRRMHCPDVSRAAW